MRKIPPAANPDSYVASLRGWQRACVERLRAAVHRAGPLEETIKWGNLVYLANGPVAVIRAEETRVLFGFWRGKRLTGIEPRLKPSGKYEMATIHIGEGPATSPTRATQLIRAACVLNETLGDPTKDAPKRKSRVKRAKPARRPAGKRRGK
ncbi:MAG: DUF1801 domain-containing protein [Rhizomicrobium sp.]